MVKKYALTTTAIGMIFLTSMIIQIPSVYARGPSSVFGRANGLLPLPNILSSSPSSDKGSEITPNVSDNSNNISPNAAGGGNRIPDGSITTSKLADGAVTTPKIADQAVTGSKIAGLNKLLFATCNSSYDFVTNPHNILSCSFPGVEQGDMIIVTAQQFLDKLDVPFDCAIVLSAKPSNSDPETVEIRITNTGGCTGYDPNPIRATFAMMAYHENS